MLHSSSAAAGKPRSAARTKPKNFKAKLKKALPTLFLLAFAALFAVFPDRYVPVCLDGIALWALNVLPAVFPFLFVTALLRASGGAQRVSRVFSPFAKALFGTGGEGGFCFFMSVLSGYPVGASLVSAFKADGVFSDDEAQILACACSTSGPLFVIGSVGAGMFSDKKIGFAILAAHLLAAPFVGRPAALFLLPAPKGRKTKPLYQKAKRKDTDKRFFPRGMRTELRAVRDRRGRVYRRFLRAGRHGLRFRIALSAPTADRLTAAARALRGGAFQRNSGNDGRLSRACGAGNAPRRTLLRLSRHAGRREHSLSANRLSAFCGRQPVCISVRKAFAGRRSVFPLSAVRRPVTDFKPFAAPRQTLLCPFICAEKLAFEDAPFRFRRERPLPVPPPRRPPLPQRNGIRRGGP